MRKIGSILLVFLASVVLMLAMPLHASCGDDDDAARPILTKQLPSAQ